MGRLLGVGVIHPGSSDALLMGKEFRSCIISFLTIFAKECIIISSRGVEEMQFALRWVY